MKYFKLLVLLIGLISFVVKAQNIIPEPQYLELNTEQFKLSSTTQIHYAKGLKEQAELLQAALSPATGWDLKLKRTSKKSHRGIYLKIDAEADLSKEGYLLDIGKKGIQITAKTSAGVFYGIQSLLQLMPIEIYNIQRQKNMDWVIPGVNIIDNPQYVWRGMMLDVSRYFFSKAYVLKYIDMMAMYKMNVLHFHLIDDAGWRIEIKKYPKLTSVGAWRGEGIERTGGYYTQEDIKEIVAYAIQRNVEVIPEIEVPAHTLAAISAYPYLSCRNEEVSVPTYHFISRDLYCVGQESTFEFLEDVFDEVTDLFPSAYIHIGGDEAKYDRWKDCVHCQKKKKDLGLENEHELQLYFNQRMQTYLKQSGKTIVGWDEIIEKGLKEKAVGMIWHDKKKAFTATKAGHDVVMALTDHCYFDVAESSIPGEIKAATWLKPISLQQVYKLNPMLEGLDEGYRSQVLGGEATMWSDQFVHGTILQEFGILNENRSEKYFDYLTFPRMSALAEVLWSPISKQNWNHFEKKMCSHYNRYDQAGYGYRIPQPKLIGTKLKNGKFQISLENLVDGAEIRYSTNGTPVNVYSPVYSQTLEVANLIDFQAITVVNRLQYSLPLAFPRDYKQYKQYGRLLKEWNPTNVGNRSTLLKLNATGKINKNKTYKVSFVKLEGDGNTEISSFEVYKNGKKLTEINTEHIVSNSNRTATYKFDIESYETGAVFEIRVVLKSNSVTYGAVFIK